MPAGGLLKGESLEDAAYRELREETGLGPDDIDGLHSPRVLVIPSEMKTSIGLIYFTAVKNPLPRGGITLDSDEVELVRPFTNDELAELLHRPENVYKPDFNIPAIQRWFSWCREF